MIPPGKVLCHYHVLLVPTATYQPLSAQTVKQAMPVKDLTHLQHHHQGYVHWVTIALMACERLPAQLVHMVMSLVPQVKLQDVRLVLLVITAQQGPEVIQPTGLCKGLLLLLWGCTIPSFENLFYFIIQVVLNFKEQRSEYENQIPMNFTTINK